MARAGWPNGAPTAVGGTYGRNGIIGTVGLGGFDGPAKPIRPPPRLAPVPVPPRWARAGAAHARAAAAARSKERMRGPPQVAGDAVPYHIRPQPVAPRGESDSAKTVRRSTPRRFIHACGVGVVFRFLRILRSLRFVRFSASCDSFFVPF